MEADECDDDDAGILGRLFGHLSDQAELFARHQRRDDPDMELADRLLLLRSQLDEDPADFLGRYHRHLPPEMADSLQRVLLRRRRQEAEACDADTRSSFYLAAMRRAGRPAQRKNRRYQALQRLVVEGEYFSDESMRNREPYLYHRYIGRYQLASEAPDRPDNTGVMTHFLMRHCDRVDENARYAIAAAEAGELESDSDDEVEQDGEPAGPLRIPEAERRLLRSEFTSLMHRRFLAGEDTAHFDYASVDNDDSADVSAQYLQDEEDGYFDSEEPS